MDPINEIQITLTDSDSAFSSISARIDDEGCLRMEGQDMGEAVENIWSHDDHEYCVSVDGSFKDTILLLLVKDRFKTVQEFRRWLALTHIPGQFYSWP
jgi:hypothetical protein